MMIDMRGPICFCYISKPNNSTSQQENKFYTNAVMTSMLPGQQYVFVNIT